jgi:hypothetical protein
MVIASAIPKGGVAVGAKWDKLVRGMVDDLDSGEEILSAVKAIPDGEAEAGILGAAAGVSLGAGGFILGADAGANVGAEKRTSTEGAGVASSKGKQAAVILTDRRILVYTVGISGKAKEFLGAIARSDVADVAMGTTKLFGQTMPLLAVTTTNGHTAGFGIAKIRKKDGVAFVDAFEASAALSDPDG